MFGLGTIIEAAVDAAFEASKKTDEVIDTIIDDVSDLATTECELAEERMKYMARARKARRDRWHEIITKGRDE